MARAALGWSLNDLAAHARLGRATVARFELGEPVSGATVAALRDALEDAGIELIAAGAIVENGSGSAGVGVRFRSSGRS